MTKKQVNIEAGKLLLAQPFMLDGNFKRAAVLVCDHNEKDGTVGFILNKAIDMKINDLIADFPEFDSEVYYGGPVATDTIHYIHDVKDILEESIPVTQGLCWGGNYERLKFLVKSNLIEPRNIKFFVGYSGWSPGQLREELDIGSWIVNDMDLNYAFARKPDELWKDALKNKGDIYTVISQMPDSALYN